MARKSGNKFISKTQIVSLLDKQAGISTSDLVCSAETAALLQCWAELEVAPTGEEAVSPCESHESALRRCEMRMNNRSVSVAKAGIRRGLIFQMLRLANKSVRK